MYRKSRKSSQESYPVFDLCHWCCPVLQIVNALASDQGEYTCSASNELGIVTGDGFLTVQGESLLGLVIASFEFPDGNLEMIGGIDLYCTGSLK